ncbi:metallophosphoesterase family protein [Stackebrandtia nassauensis]|uniref:Metallophosphoesterase n=1 Tax=Stackebrandtia nassauensis (strain DSM 44728 / CIP 108903 / NRRL B-16338 / NBRC 102104 / LLR-40K-21) TaxID=446470 RepID=D3Q3U6_STANL|nr:metallophosphoesterase [Stackebrandtia nassauensis]ADD44013.1 metallophosphoesterase [Stackebrandtia nassauensis DSM 44728]
MRRTGKAIVFTAIALFAAGLGVRFLGTATADIGPFHTTMSMEPATDGESEVELPPLGSLIFNSHSGPIKMTVRIDSLDEFRTERLIDNPKEIRMVGQEVPADVRAGFTNAGLSGLGGATLAGLILGGLAFRTMRRAAICGSLSLVLTATALGISAGSMRPESVAEPRYEGLLVNAPAFVGGAQQVADSYEKYRSQLEGMIVNLSQFYTLGRTLPSFVEDKDTIRVLHVSDLHLNPSAWNVIDSVAKQFSANAVLDTGDITDWGSTQEAAVYTKGIKRLDTPYVYIRGNHDSTKVTKEVAKQKNATVVDDEVVEIAGLRIAGIGDPRYAPDATSAPSDIREEQVLLDSGNDLRDTIAESGGADLAMVHDPVCAGPLAEEVPVVLAGHKHQRLVSKLDDDTVQMVQGSTGGAGLSGIDKDNPHPLTLSVLYFDKSDARLKAVDDIAVGGTGETQVSLQRRIFSKGMPDDNTDLVPNPDEVEDGASGDPEGD